MKNTRSNSFLALLACSALLSASSAHAQSWSGATSGAWLTTTNWTGGVAAGSDTITTDTDIAVFSVATQPTVGINMATTGGAYYLGAIEVTQNTTRTFNNSSTTAAGVLTLNGATVNSVANTILRNSSQNLTTITNGTGVGTLGLALGNATNNIIQINGGGGITIASNITGTNRNLTLAANNHGSGILTLSGTNSYTGNTRIEAGTVQFTSQASLYNNGTAAAWSKDNLVVSHGAAAFFTMGGVGQFTAANINTLLGLSDSANNGFRSHATIGLDTSGGIVSYTNAIANPNSGNNILNVTKLGGNTLTLEQNNTYTGRTFISAGTLQLGNGGTTGSLSASSAIRNNGTLTINRSNDVAQGTDFSSAPIIGTGAFIQNGTGIAAITTLNAANTFTGTTTVSGGVLNLTNALALQNSALVTTGAGTVTINGSPTITSLTLGGLSGATGNLATVFSSGFTGTVTNLTLNPLSGTVTYGGVIDNGAMTLTKTGAGTQILSGANLYTGATIIREGTLTVGNGSTGSLNGIAGTALTFTGTGTFNVAEAAGSIQGMGALTLSSGDATITSTAAAATSVATLTLSSFATRPVGTTANFSLATNTSSTSGTPNKIVVSGTNAIPLNTGSNNSGIFFGGSNYARYDAAGFVRAVTYGTDTNAPTALSGPLVTNLGTISAATDVQFTGATRATTTSGVVSGTNTNTLVVTNGALFTVGQILTGTNIAANSYITGISGNTLTLANAGGVNAIGGTAVAASTTLTPYNSVTAQTTGSVNTLNLSGVGASLTLSSGQTLSINGILRSAGTAAASSVISGGTGIQTATSGGEMVVRTNLSTDVLTIASPILDNGSSSLTKSGLGTLLLSGANTYAGGTFLNGGTVVISNSSAFGASTGLVTVNATSRINAIGGVNIANSLTVNAGQTLTLQNPRITTSTAEFSGVLSGSGDLFLVNSGTNAIQGILAFTNTSNNFTGNVVLSGSGSGDEHFQFKSLGDGGNFTFAKNGNRQLITYTGDSNLTFNTRQIAVADTMFGTTDRQGMDGGGSNPVNIFQNNGAGTISFTKDMVVGNFATNYGVLYLGGTNAGDNTFSGNISDTSGSSKFAIGKFDSGKWILSGTNTFEGNILIGGGTLQVATIANSSIAQPLGIGTAIQLGVGGSNANGTLLYTGGTASTDKQVQIGAVANAFASTGAGSILNDGTGAMTFTNATFNPLTTGVTGTRTLTLGGSYAGASNAIQGVIQNNATAGLVSLAKTGASTWVLSGNNTYTGITTITNGTLSVSTMAIGGSASGIGAATNVATNLVFDGGTLRYTGAAQVTDRAFTINADKTATIDVSNGLTLAGHTGTTTTGALTKTGAGNLTLTGASTYSGGTTISMGSITANNSSALGTNAVSVTAGARLIVDANSITLANNITLNGTATGGAIYNGDRAVGNVTNLTGQITLNSTSNVSTWWNDKTLRLSGKITGAGGLNFTKQTASVGGRFLISGSTNDYMGSTTVTGETGNRFGFTGQAMLYLGATNALPTTTDLTLNNADLYLNGQSQSLPSIAGTGSFSVQNGSTTAATLSLGAGNAISTFTGIIKDNGISVTNTSATPATVTGTVALNKIGNGTLTITNTQGYTGATTVSAGTLIISSTGSTNAGSAVAVTGTASLVVDGTVNGSLTTAAGTTLSGTGTIQGNATISGFHNPGNSPGIQTFNGDLVYDGSATVQWELIGDTAANNPNPSAIFDQMLVDGDLEFAATTTVNLVFNGASSLVDWSDSFWEDDQSWLVYDVNGTITNLNNLTVNTVNWLDGDENPFLSERPDGSFSFSQGVGGVYLNYAVVPETSTGLLGALGALALLRRRRK